MWINIKVSRGIIREMIMKGVFMAILGKKKISISKDQLKYRIDHLIFSQNMLNTWLRDRDEFVEKYINGIFWSDSSEKDREYEENMSYGRDFHLLCQRLFMGLPLLKEDPYGKTLEDYPKIERIGAIKSAYERHFGKNVVFRPELEIEYRGQIVITVDLLVELYKDGELYKIDIWDWKTERRRISEVDALAKMQTIVYMYVCKETIGRKIDCSNISMHYYQPTYDNNVKLVYTEELHKKNSDKIWAMIDEIRSEESYTEYMDRKIETE